MCLSMLGSCLSWWMCFSIWKVIDIRCCILYYIIYYILYIYYYTIHIIISIIIYYTYIISYLILYSSDLSSQSSSFLFHLSSLPNIPHPLLFFQSFLSSPYNPILFYPLPHPNIQSSHSKYTCRVFHLLIYIPAVSHPTFDPACFIGVDG